MCMCAFFFFFFCFIIVFIETHTQRFAIIIIKDFQSFVLGILSLTWMLWILHEAKIQTHVYYLLLFCDSYKIFNEFSFKVQGNLTIFYCKWNWLELGKKAKRMRWHQRKNWKWSKKPKQQTNKVMLQFFIWHLMILLYEQILAIHYNWIFVMSI